MNGFLLLDKPAGLSSSGCVYALRKILEFSKIGHCGTLDPLATGVLPLCIGEATKFSNYISDQSKEYCVEIVFGVQTTTGDLEGEEIYNEPYKLSVNDLEACIPNFLGTQDQMPPMYSAIKVEGRPLYYWARKGVFLKRKSREICINDIKIVSHEENKVTLKVGCTKGTYIRSLVEDIGVSLSTKATVSCLRRTKVGLIDETRLVGLNELKEHYKKSIVSPDFLLAHLPELHLDEIDAKKIRNGQRVDYNAPQEINGIVRIYEGKGLFLGIGSVDSSNTLSPKRLLSNQTI
jgi:tRNA pseudouridine55 synthase